MSKRSAKPLDVVIFDDGNELTPQMQVFVSAYLVCLNATEAARIAKYSGDDASLAAHASRLLRNGKVAREIDKRLNQYAMSANEVLAHLTQIARGDIADVINEFGATDISEAKRRGKSQLVKRHKVKVTTITETDGTEREIIETEVEMYSRMDALQTLAKYHNLTNRVIIEDWRTELLELVRTGQLDQSDIEQELGPDIARELLIPESVSSAASGEG